MKRKFLIGFLAVCVNLHCFSIGMQDKIDSLERLVYQEKDPHRQILLLDQMHTEVERFDRDKALLLSKKILRIAKTESKDDLIFALNLMGYTYRAMELQDSALHYFQKGLERAVLLKDTVYLAKINFNIGATWMDLKHYEKALQYMQTGAEWDLKGGNRSRAATNYNAIGSVYAQLGKPDTAEAMAFKGLEAARDSDNPLDLAQSYQAIAFIKEKQKEFETAKEYYEKQIEKTEKLGHWAFTARGHRNIANVCRLQGRFREAIAHANKALELSQKIGEISLTVAVYSDLQSITFQQGNYKAAYHYLLEMIKWNDTLDVHEGREKAKEIEAKYQAEQAKKENQILQQQKDIAQLETEKTQHELEQSRIMIWSSVGGLLLLIGLAYSLYNRNKLKQKANDELQVANDIINEKNEDITSSLEYASKIQEALLPTKESTSLFADSFFMLRPKDIVSGDFFWYTEYKGKKIFTAVDCTGHGVPGAFMSMIGNTFLHEIINEKGITQPSEILNQLRLKIVTALSQRDARKDGMDMALCTLDETNMTLEFAGANNPLWYVQNNNICEIKGDKQPVGYMPEKEGPFTNHKINVKKGDKLYVFSDGFPDQFGGPKGKKFKYKQMRELLYSISSKPMKDQKQILEQSFDHWKGDLEQIDDVCIIGVRI